MRSPPSCILPSHHPDDPLELPQHIHIRPFWQISGVRLRVLLHVIPSRHEDPYRVRDHLRRGIVNDFEVADLAPWGWIILISQTFGEESFVFGENFRGVTGLIDCLVHGGDREYGMMDTG